jgi:hypothetical protein
VLPDNNKFWDGKNFDDNDDYTGDDNNNHNKTDRHA